MRSTSGIPFITTISNDSREFSNIKCEFSVKSKHLKKRMMPALLGGAHRSRVESVSGGLRSAKALAIEDNSDGSEADKAEGH